MTAKAKKWLLNGIKFGVCALAIWFFAGIVTLNDRVRLADNPADVWIVQSESADGDQRVIQIQHETSGELRNVTMNDLAPDEALEKGQRAYQPGLKSIISRADSTWGLGALAVFAPVPFIIAWRLRLLLSTQDISMTYRDALLLTFAGNFFNFTLPGTTGGDIYKAYHIAKKTHKRAEGVTIVVLDRVFGLVSFLMIAAITVFAARHTNIVGDFGTIVGYLLLALVIGGMAFASKRVRELVRYDRILDKLPMSDKIRRIDQTAFNLRNHAGKALVALIGTAISHFCFVTTVYCLARCFGIVPTGEQTQGELYLATLIATVVGSLFAAIPISVQGFGQLEAVFYKILVEGGWCMESAMIVLTISARLVQVFWSLPGVIAPWLGLERPTLSAEDQEAMLDPTAAVDEHIFDDQPDGGTNTPTTPADGAAHAASSTN